MDKKQHARIQFAESIIHGFPAEASVYVNELYGTTTLAQRFDIPKSVSSKLYSVFLYWKDMLYESDLSETTKDRLNSCARRFEVFNTDVKSTCERPLICPFCRAVVIQKALKNVAANLCAGPLYFLLRCGEISKYKTLARSPRSTVVSIKNIKITGGKPELHAGYFITKKARNSFKVSSLKMIHNLVFSTLVFDAENVLKHDYRTVLTEVGSMKMLTRSNSADNNKIQQGS